MITIYEVQDGGWWFAEWNHAWGEACWAMAGLQLSARRDVAGFQEQDFKNLDKPFTRMFVSCFVIKGATIARIVSKDSLSNRWNCRKASGSSAFNSRKRLGYAPCCSLLIIYSLVHVFLLTDLLRRSRQSKRITKNAILSLCLSTSTILYYIGWKYLKSYEQAIQFHWLID